MRERVREREKRKRKREREKERSIFSLSLSFFFFWGGGQISIGAYLKSVEAPCNRWTHIISLPFSLSDSKGVTGHILYVKYHH